MSLLEDILYGLIAGVTEFLPVSSEAHRALLRYLFGAGTKAPLQELLVHIGLVFAVMFACRDAIARLRREQKNLAGNGRRRNRSPDNKNLYDLRLLKTAAVPLIIGSLLYIVTAKFESSLMHLLLFWLINGIILLLADHTSRGNRDSRTMSALDGIVMGIAGALRILPGVSGTGMICAYTAARGVDWQHTINWALILSIPVLLLGCCFDIFAVITQGFGIANFREFLGCILSGAAAFGGGFLGVSVLKLALSQSGFSKFAYYSIGAALFSFILYLIT